MPSFLVYLVHREFLFDNVRIANSTVATSTGDKTSHVVSCGVNPSEVRAAPSTAERQSDALVAGRSSWVAEFPLQGMSITCQQSAASSTATSALASCDRRWCDPAWHAAPICSRWPHDVLVFVITGLDVSTCTTHLTATLTVNIRRKPRALRERRMSLFHGKHRLLV